MRNILQQVKMYQYHIPIGMKLHKKTAAAVRSRQRSQKYPKDTAEFMVHLIVNVIFKSGIHKELLVVITNALRLPRFCSTKIENSIRVRIASRKTSLMHD